MSNHLKNIHLWLQKSAFSTHKSTAFHISHWKGTKSLNSSICRLRLCHWWIFDRYHQQLQLPFKKYDKTHCPFLSWTYLIFIWPFIILYWIGPNIFWRQKFIMIDEWSNAYLHLTCSSSMKVCHFIHCLLSCPVHFSVGFLFNF